MEKQKKEKNLDVKEEKSKEQAKEELKELKEELKETKDELKEAKQELGKCEEKKEDFEAKAKEYYEQLLRLKADFENYRKRIEKEKPELIKWGKYELILKIFPLYEILLSAHEHITKVDPDKCSKEQINKLIEGLDMIFKEFSKLFESEGIKEIDLLNKPYDPMLCEIIGVVDGNDENDGLVVEEIQKGYMIDSKVLRPAKVKIAKKKISNTNENKEENK